MNKKEFMAHALKKVETIVGKHFQGDPVLKSELIKEVRVALKNSDAYENYKKTTSLLLDKKFEFQSQYQYQLIRSNQSNENLWNQVIELIREVFDKVLGTAFSQKSKERELLDKSGNFDPATEKEKGILEGSIKDKISPRRFTD
jgi:hypothetical protein